MLSISIGPLALPLAPLLLVGALVLAIVLARRLTGPEQRAWAESALWWAGGAGLAAARVVHLIRHAEAYAASPWSVIDLRDGGFHEPTGLLVAGAVLAHACSRRPVLQRPLLAGVLGALVVWAGATTWLQPDAGNGAPLPPVSVTPLEDGAAQDLAALLRGEPAVINLWASWCGPCRAEMPVLAAAQREAGTPRIVLVNQGESAAVVRAWLRREAPGLRDVWLDPASRAGPALGSQALPTTVFVDACGRRVQTHVGPINAAALRVAMQAPAMLARDCTPAR